MLLAVALSLSLTAAPAPAPVDRAYDLALMRILEQAFPDLSDDTALPDAGRQLLDEVLTSPAFVHEAVGPFDVYVLLADELAGKALAQKTLEQAVDGLTPLVPIMTLHFGRSAGLISGQRLPIVLCAADATRELSAFDCLIALLDHCESGPGGWIASNGSLWNDALRQSLLVRTWDVQLVNLAHADSRAQGTAFLEHELGYLTLAHLVHGLIRQGSWGLVPPWLDQGLIDELDIEAYGESWVGEDKWVATTEGWFRAGWSGFLPEGASPPPPVTGPPADLATTIRETGDAWARRSRSATRHWADLAADLSSKYPASLAFMAEHGSFLPRDRAYARCALHLLLVVAPPDGPSLLEALDQPAVTLPSGMYAAEPLTSLLSARLGGVPEVERLAALPLGEKLQELGHPEIAERITTLGGEQALLRADHREQGEWLYGQLDLQPEARAELFRLFLEAEYYEQMQAWKPIGAALDAAVRAALKATPTFPDSLAQRQAVAKAFCAALAH
jgi:hypothetical protein